MIFNIGIVFTIFFLLLVLSMIWPPDSPWAPWWQTDKKTARKMCKLAKVKSGDVVFDLGSGDGTSLIMAAKEFKARGVGIEVDPLRILLSKVFVRTQNVSDKVIIKKNNFFKEDISSANVVFMYLVPKTLYRLKKKLLSELKPGTRIVTVTYEIPGGLANKKFSNDYFKTLGMKKSLKVYNERPLFLYIVPNKKIVS